VGFTDVAVLSRGGLNGATTTDHCFPARFFLGQNGIERLPVNQWSPPGPTTFISGGAIQDDLGMNQTDFSLGFAFDNFFYSNRPLRVVPVLALHVRRPIRTNGPNQRTCRGQCVLAAVSRFRWQTDPNQIIRPPELGVRSVPTRDFRHVHSTAIR